MGRLATTTGCEGFSPGTGGDLLDQPKDLRFADGGVELADPQHHRSLEAMVGAVDVRKAAVHRRQQPQAGPAGLVGEALFAVTRGDAVVNISR